VIMTDLKSVFAAKNKTNAVGCWELDGGKGGQSQKKWRGRIPWGWAGGGRAVRRGLDDVAMLMAGGTSSEKGGPGVRRKGKRKSSKKKRGKNGTLPNRRRAFRLMP